MYNFFPSVINNTTKCFRGINNSLYKKLTKGANSKIEEFKLIWSFVQSDNVEKDRKIDLLKTSIASKECYWLNKKEREVVFLPDTDFVESLANTKFRDFDFSKINFPYDTFMLALPSDLTINGSVVSGLLISMGNNDTLSMLDTDFINSIGIKNREWGYKVEEGNPRTIVINYVLDNESVNGELVYSSLIVTEDSLMDMLTVSDEGLLELLDSGYNNLGGINLNELELRIQQYIAKLVISLLVYIQSFGYDNVVVEGLPDSLKPKGIRLGKEAKSGLNSVKIKNVFPREVGSHVRSAHFRQLRNERYYRNEYANIPVGERIIYVSESMVGLKGSSAETVVNID